MEVPPWQDSAVDSVPDVMIYEMEWGEAAQKSPAIAI